ncbi:MAG: response regulator transcription factor [Chloroflexales bacterium]
MEQRRILVVEDDGLTRLMLEFDLQGEGHAVLSVASGAAAISLLMQQRFDLLITDLHLPDTDGVHVMQGALALDPCIVVIILIGSADLISAIAATSHRAFRYLLKPISNDELTRNVSEALAHRRLIGERAPPYSPDQSPPASDHSLRIGHLLIDLSLHRMTCSGHVIPLSSGEFALLVYLARRRGTVVSAEEIVREVLHYSCSPLEARYLLRHRIYKLRQKIESSPYTSRLIHSVRGTGYRLAEDDELL